jgi:hypothetical protein
MRRHEVRDDVQTAVDFIRHYVIGDDEQTRIEDEEVWKHLPIAKRMRSLVELGDYYAAVRLFVWTALAGRTLPSLEKEITQTARFFDITPAELKSGYRNIMKHKR